MDVAPGPHALELTTYADTEATEVIGRACTETSLSPGARICFDLTLAAVSVLDLGGDLGGGRDGSIVDAGGGADLACGPGSDTSDDPLNCGGCGAVCSTSHIAATCSGGKCLGSCLTGFGDCNADRRTDGCETPNNTSNCGACGRACGTANATATACNGIACTYTCNGGFMDCNPLASGNPTAASAPARLLRHRLPDHAA